MESAGSAPLLNKYKLDYVLRRIPQTLLGGPKVQLGSGLPFYVYVCQTVVWLMPLLLAAVFTIVAELDHGLQFVAAYCYGGCMFFFVFITLGVATAIRWKSVRNNASKRQNILSEDDEIEFVSCTGIETVNFLIQTKRYLFNIIVHAIISGVCSGILFLYILPTRTEKLFGITGSGIPYYIVGWIITCTGHYSIIGQLPPEPAQFGTSILLEVESVGRILHLTLFGIVGLIARFYSTLDTADYVLHVIFLVNPILWLLGVLPPIRALLSWAGDQVLVFLLGGSAMATDTRLFVMLFISLVSAGIIYAINDISLIAVLSAAFGIILSLDLLSFLEQSVKQIAKLNVWRDSVCCQRLVQLLPSRPFQKTMLEPMTRTRFANFILVFCLLGLNIGIVGIVRFVFSDSLREDMNDPLCYTILSVLCVHYITVSFGKAFLFFGYIRNPFFAKSLNDTESLRMPFLPYGLLFHLSNTIFFVVLPALLSCFAAVNVKSHSNFFDAVLTLRAFRWIWQETLLGSVDVIILFTVNKLTSLSWWTSQTFVLKLFVISLVRDRIEQFFKKTYVVALMTFRFYFSSKQRHKHWKQIIFVTLGTLPLLLLLFALSVILSSSLLPIFTLPLIIVGFPRPNRFWPEATVSSKSSSSDWIYYESLLSEVSSQFSKAIHHGGVLNLRNGDYYLGRFQDRLIICSILEKGLFHVNFTVKGLELQETSCHASEAAMIDEVYEYCYGESKDASPSWLNPYFFHVLAPTDILLVRAYSDAKNVLTGIIEQTETHKKIDDYYVKSLIWVIVHHCWKRRKDGSPAKCQSAPKRSQTNNSIATKVTYLDGPQEDTKHQAWTTGSSENASNSDGSLMSKGSQNSDRSLLRDWAPPSKNEIHTSGVRGIGFPAPDSGQGIRALKESKAQTGPKLLEDDDSDDFGFDDDEFDIPPKMSEARTVPDFDNKEYGDSYTDHSTSIALNTRIPSASQCHTLSETKADKSDAVLPYPSKLERRETPSLFFPLSSAHSKQLEPPSWWIADLPIDQSEIKKYVGKFSENWYHAVLSSIPFNTESGHTLESVCSDQGLQSLYRHLVLTCYYVIEVAGLYGAPIGPLHIYDTFQGTIAWSHAAQWLEDDQELKDIVIKAYRYAVKLAYDEMVIGDIETDADLMSCLQTFDQKWFMGKDNEESWTQAVLEQRPFLFSIGLSKENNTYTSRTLTMQDTGIPIGKLNSECIRALWSSLSFELLYLTNDDEERYSIQAHPHLLRNITVQAADPPLGYPVYSSGLTNGWHF